MYWDKGAPRELGLDYMLGVTSVQFPQVPVVYSGAFEQHEVLHCFAAEELNSVSHYLGIFDTQWYTFTPAIHSTSWHC